MDMGKKMQALARMVLSETTVHYAPDGENPPCGYDARTEVCSDDPDEVEGCIDCLMEAVRALPDDK